MRPQGTTKKNCPLHRRPSTCFYYEVFNLYTPLVLSRAFVASRYGFEAMASLQIAKSGLASVLGSRSDFGRRLSWTWSEHDIPTSETRFLKLQTRGLPGTVLGRRFRIRCRIPEGENDSNGEERPESLFMKELRRRGMTPTSLIDDSNRKMLEVDEEIKLKEDDRGFSNRKMVSTEIEKNLSNQRERSMALNSEGLEGLVPRAKLLVTLGGTFFLAFGPLILLTLASFSALYIYFGPSFVHDAGKTSVSPPPYVDPYKLLEDERLSQTAPLIK